LCKDLECTFGILEGQFCILKSGVQLWGVDAYDKIWCTCCALHSWLLDIDSHCHPWDSALGMFKESEVTEHVPHAALQQLHMPAARHAYDFLGMGRGLDGEPNNAHDDDNDDEGMTDSTIVFQLEGVHN